MTCDEFVRLLNRLIVDSVRAADRCGDHGKLGSPWTREQWHMARDEAEETRLAVLAAFDEANQHQAAVERVRDLCATAGAGVNAVFITDVLRALDGDVAKAGQP